MILSDKKRFGRNRVTNLMNKRAEFIGSKKENVLKLVAASTEHTYLKCSPFQVI